jgi:NAD(P)-dependent dehydrogenase (short-subunit alcohol dehydrogenase family)
MGNIDLSDLGWEERNSTTAAWSWSDSKANSPRPDATHKSCGEQSMEECGLPETGRSRTVSYGLTVGGRVTFPFLSLYHGTKWAVDGFSESLSYELGELGIQVKIIEPGGVDTDFGGRSMDFCVQEGLTDYDEAQAKFQANRANSMLGHSGNDHEGPIEMAAHNWHWLL